MTFLRTILRGVRPAALAAVSERERLRAHPQRAQAAVNHVRALESQAKACATNEQAGQQEEQVEAKSKRGRGRK
jgi:hypothetical protein